MNEDENKKQQPEQEEEKPIYTYDDRYYSGLIDE